MREAQVCWGKFVRVDVYIKQLNSAMMLPIWQNNYEILYKQNVYN
jgi:hypothetical protein